jgi:hypothetical protein
VRNKYYLSHPVNGNEFVTLRQHLSIKLFFPQKRIWKFTFKNDQWPQNVFKEIDEWMTEVNSRPRQENQQYECKIKKKNWLSENSWNVGYGKLNKSNKNTV